MKHIAFSRNNPRSYIVLFLLSLLIPLGCNTGIKAAMVPLENIKLPPGFKIEVFADGLPNARTLALGDEGTVFVGTRKSSVYAIRDNDGDGEVDEKHQIASGLNMPNGIAFYQGALFVAEVERILRFDAIENQLKNPPKAVVIHDDLPIETHHGWRSIAFGPDERLYIAIGAPCNICLEEGYAQIRSMKPDGSDENALPKAYVIQWGSIGTRKRANSGLPIMAATGWVMTHLRVNSTGSKNLGNILVFRIAMEVRSRTLSLVS